MNEKVEKALSKVEDYSIGVSIDISFSYEAQRWDLQLTSETTIKIGDKQEKFRRNSNCIELDKVAIRKLDIEDEVSSELALLWQALSYKIKKHLESQDILMDQDSFTEYIKKRLG